MQRAEGYRLVGVFEDEPEHALAVAGFRVGHMLMWGRFLYVDDLSTLPEARRRGYGRQLLEWLGEEAERLGCEQFHLDSGVGPTRTDAHRLYFNTGLGITSFHFRATSSQLASARRASPSRTNAVAPTERQNASDLFSSASASARRPSPTNASAARSRACASSGSAPISA